jgi:hypothetical protein
MIEKDILLENTVNVLKQEEVDELLGFAYFDIMIAKLGWKKSFFIEKFQIYLEEDLYVKKDKPMFDFFIELISLTYNLYKWGQLLFSVDEAHYANTIMTLTIKDEERFTILSELEHYFSFSEQNIDEKGIALIDIADDSVVYMANSESKSAILSSMLYLYDRGGVGIAVVDMKKHSEQYSGSYLTYEEERVKNDLAYINYIRKEFHTYKERLDELQHLFKHF